MPDNVLVNKLVDVLEEEASLYGDILSIERGKTDVIINGKVAELEDITKIEQSFSEKLQKLENDREKIIEQIALESKISPSAITVTWIIENGGELEETRKLKKIRANIMNLVNEIKKVNETNAKLIQNSLEYIDFSINLITSAGSPGGKYGNDGREGKEERRSFFDVKL